MALQETYTSTTDNLFAGTQVMPVVADGVTLAAAGEGAEPLILRGTLLTTTDGKTYTPATDGDDVFAVLAEDTLADKEKQAPAYLTGEFNRRALITGDDSDVADFIFSARKAGIFIKDTVSA